MTTTRWLIYKKNAERPGVKLWLFDDDRTLIDFSTGYTFVFKIGVIGSPALLTKTTSIAGAVGAGVEPTGTPNVVITWTTGELNLTPGAYAWELVCTTSSMDRVFFGGIRILDIIT